MKVMRIEFYKTKLKNLDTCHSEELISSRRYKVNESYEKHWMIPYNMYNALTFENYKKLLLCVLLYTN